MRRKPDLAPLSAIASEDRPLDASDSLGYETGSFDDDVYVRRLDRPADIYAGLNRLAYDLLADEYAQRPTSPSSNRVSATDLAQLLLRHLPPGSPSRILELGPGSGEVLAILSSNGRSATAVELSPKMAAVASAHAPDALVIVGDARRARFARGSFDAVYASAFIHLFPKAEAARLLGRVRHWIQPDGLLFVSTTAEAMSGEGIEIKPDYVRRVARFRARWKEDEFARLVTEGGYSIVERTAADDRGKSWVAYVCRPLRC